MSQSLNKAHLSNDFFSHEALQLSIILIRSSNPGLADAIKKAIDQINPTSYDPRHKNNFHYQRLKGEIYFHAQLLENLHAHTIGKIVSALTELGEQALQNQNVSIEYITTLRKLIDDWVQLTEWVLKNSAKNKKTLH